MMMKMMRFKSSIIIGAIIATLLGPNLSLDVVFASSERDLVEEERESGFYYENGYVKGQSDRPPINPDFDPDYDCLFDTFLLKCVPGSEQKCPEPQFTRNDDETCFPMTLVNGGWEWECPEDYHAVDDDETGQCYPNSEGCPDYSGYPVYVFEEGKEEGDSDSCTALHYLCRDGDKHEKCDEYLEGLEREFGD
jgi:hypothetical protein